MWVLHTSTELRALRAGLHEALTGQPLLAGQSLDDIPERMLVVVTELATNAIKYGRPPTVVRLLRGDGEYVIDVADQDLGTIPELADTRPVDAGGRGLLLASKLSLDVGWYATATAKHVWASFPA